MNKYTIFASILAIEAGTLSAFGTPVAAYQGNPQVSGMEQNSMHMLDIFSKISMMRKTSYRKRLSAHM